MGLFSKYFGEQSEQTDNNDYVKYIQPISKLAEEKFGFKKTEYFDNKKSDKEEYYKALLTNYESKILCLMIFGYYMLRDLKLHIQYKRLVFEDLFNNQTYTKVISGFTQYAAATSSDLIEAMEWSLNGSVSGSFTKDSIINSYFTVRFETYGDVIASGLNYYHSFPNSEVARNYNPSLEKAFYYYSHPEAGDQTIPGYEKLEGRQGFRDKVVDSYLTLKDNLNEQF